MNAGSKLNGFCGPLKLKINYLQIKMPYIHVFFLSFWYKSPNYHPVDKFPRKTWTTRTAFDDPSIHSSRVKIFFSFFFSSSYVLWRTIFPPKDNTQTTTGYALSFNYLLHVYACIFTTMKVYWTLKAICWWIIRVNKRRIYSFALNLL